MSALKLLAGKSMLMYGLPIALLALVASHLWLYHKGVTSERSHCTAKQAEADRDYIARLQQRIADNAALAAQHREARNDADRDYQKALADIARLRAVPVRLRDPGRAPDCRPAVPAAAGPAGSTARRPSGHDLSPAAHGFLLDFAADADRAAAYAITCHRWVMGR